MNLAPLPPPEQRIALALEALRRMALDEGAEIEERLEAALLVIEWASRGKEEAMAGRTFNTKTGSVSVSRKGDDIAVTVASASAVAAEKLTLNDARDLIATLQELVDAPTPTTVNLGTREMREATPDEAKRALRKVRALPKKGTRDPS